MLQERMMNACKTDDEREQNGRRTTQNEITEYNFERIRNRMQTPRKANATEHKRIRTEMQRNANANAMEW